jgi:radical SAM protein with 4Fe4S-binding SPASM domain
MCVREKMHAKIGDMSFEDFKKVVDKIDTLFKINLSGQGELFMHPDIFKMINYANKRGILVNINSNGTLLNEKIIDNICKSDIGEMGISIDSPNKERYEKIRIGANYDKLLKNIKALSSELKKRNRHTILTMTPIIFKENIDELPDFIRLAKKIGMTKVAMQTLQTKENFLGSYDEAMKNQLVVKDIQRLRKKMGEAKKLAKQYSIPLIFDEEERPGCIWPWRGIYVTCSGDVTACCKIVDTKEYSLGNILKENFWSVWNGKKYQQMRRLLRDRKCPAACIGCNAV